MSDEAPTNSILYLVEMYDNRFICVAFVILVLVPILTQNLPCYFLFRICKDVVVTLLGGAVKTFGWMGTGTSSTTSPSPSSCSARNVSDLAGSYSTVGLWLRSRQGHGAVTGALVFSRLAGATQSERNKLDSS